MAKITITLNEGPLHGQEIKIDGPVKSDEHFTHEGYTYRVINNGQYAQCCGRTRHVEAPASAGEPAKKKAAKKTAKKKAAKKSKSKKPAPAAPTA